CFFFFFSSRRRHTRFSRDWSSDVCSSDLGAPLEDRETDILIEIFPKVKPFLRPEGVAAIESQGAFVKGEDGEWETPLVHGSECRSEERRVGKESRRGGEGAGRTRGRQGRS